MREREREREEELEFSTFQPYLGYSNHYIHTCIVHGGKKGETEMGYRETWNSTFHPVFLRSRSTAPIHGTDEYDGYIQ